MFNYPLTSLDFFPTTYPSYIRHVPGQSISELHLELDGLTRVLKEIEKLNWTEHFKLNTLHHIQHRFPQGLKTLTSDYKGLSAKSIEIFEMFEKGSIRLSAITRGDENIMKTVYHLSYLPYVLMLYSCSTLTTLFYLLKCLDLPSHFTTETNEL